MYQNYFLEHLTKPDEFKEPWEIIDDCARQRKAQQEYDKQLEYSISGYWE